MRTPLIFPLLYAGVMAFASICSALQTQTCGTSAGLTAEQCIDMDGPTQRFLTCAGVPSEPDADHILNLKGLISAGLDVYSFMRSSVTGVPVLDLSGGISLNEDHVIRAWLDIKLTPLLSSISRNFLTCLSNRNFSCSTYQTVVRELSQHFSGLDPVRQKWIYSFFMYPFLSRNTSSGCVDPEDSTEDWLMKNFGSFAVVAQVRDFTSMNMVFSGLEVLHLLSPEQKAELLLHPEVVGLTESSLGLVFQSLLSSLMPSEDPWTSNNSTTYYMSTVPSSSPQDPLGQALNGFMTAFRPVGSFVREFVSLTQKQNLNGTRSATLLQAVINLTLAEIAAPFKQNPTHEHQMDLVTFDPMNVNDWFTHVVSPILRRFLPQSQIEIHPNLTAVFHNQFYIETGMGTGAQNESQDICSVFIDNRTCGLTDLVEHVATVLHCATRSNLTLNEETLLNILLHLSQNLNTLLQQLSRTNFSSQSSPFSDLLDQIVDDTFTMSNLHDESFVRLWFQVKLKPLLPTLMPDYLTCLSHKEFSCQTYQILISELSDNMFLISEGAHNVYTYFIFSFLSRQNVSGGCPAENSSIWVTLNLGEFSQFATLMEMYQLNQDFNAIDALVVLSPRQTAELIVENFAGLPEKNVIINIVFDHILVSPEDRGLLEMLGYLIVLAGEVGLECSSYQLIVQRLQEAVVPQHMMQPVKDSVNQLEQMAPPGCFPPLVTCFSTPFNETSTCDGISRNETLLSAGLVSAPCSIDLQQYACSSLTGFTAENLAGLLKCQLSSSSSYSKEIWKLLFTKTNNVLDGALSIFSSSVANMSQPIRGDVVSQALDVIGELRLGRISPDQWSDVTFISMLLGQYLKPFLPSVSPSLLQCTSRKNLSCQTYQLILAEFPLINETQGQNMVKFFILPFLRRNATDAGCVSSANNSVEWLLKNIGLFAEFLKLTELLSINADFEPLETLVYLTSVQKVELMVEDLPGLPQKEVVINKVFDHLLVSPVDRGLHDVLINLLLISQTTVIQCSSLTLIFERLILALPFLPSDMQTLIFHTTGELKKKAVTGCSLPEPPTCLITPVNATRVCSGVNSNETLLSAGLVSAPCSIDLQQYACSSLTGFTAENLAGLLKCQLSSSSSYSKEIWKLLFTKTNNVLDGALRILSSALANMSQPIRGDVVSQVLDVIGELRLERISPDQWSDVTFISMLLGQYLKPFLPSVSPSLLQCTSSKNLSCQTYQLILAEFPLMNKTQGKNMLDFFILPFLRRNATDSGCVSSANNSVEWLLKNFGSFAEFLKLTELLSINGRFDPLETLVYLTSVQKVELMVEDLPGLPHKEVVINKVFDHLLVSPVDRGLPDVLINLLLIPQTTVIQCSSLKLIFERLFRALPFLPSDIQTQVFHTTGELKKKAVTGCSLPEPPTCPITPMNATRVCSGVNSNETLLSAGLVSAPCSIDLQQYACSSLTGFTAENLAGLLKCQLSSSSSYSKEIWKLLFTKTDNVLDGALSIFSSSAANMSQPIRGDVVSQVLDVIGELRLERISPDQWSDVTFISMLLGQYLKPFLPSVSPSLLQCTSRKNLSCQTYQHILAEFPLMNETQGKNMLDFFILPFLGRNATDTGCVSSANNSVEWLLKNFGSFAEFLKLTELLSINGRFDPLETLVYLTSVQKVELMVEDLPGLPQKEVVINTVFDHLLVSPVDRGLPDVLQTLLLIPQTTVIQCSSLTLIFKRLFLALPFLPSDMQTQVFYTTGELKKKAVTGCSLPEPPTCLITPVNATRVCSGVNSNETLLSAGLVSAPCSIDLQQYACSSLTGFTAENLAGLLKCQLSSSSSYSKEIWKLLFTKTNNVLDGALSIFSSALANMSQPIRGDVVSQVLDVIGELRLERISPDQWSDVTFISMLLGQYLKPFLPSVSPSLLQCTSSKNLSCQTYQLILAEFPLMNETQGKNMLDFFILPFLGRNATDTGCVSSANNSVEWLLKNFGSFAEFLKLTELLSINGRFDPLETLVYLTSVQKVELMVEDLPGLPQKEVVINTVFDHLLVSPVDRGLPDVLQTLLLIPQTTVIQCSSLTLIFKRLFLALPFLPSDMQTQVFYTTGELKKKAVTGCSLPEPPTCLITPVNATRVCSGVNSNETLLSAGLVSAPCSIDLQQYACSSLTGFTAENLAGLLKCQLSSSSSYSKEIWKLLFTKTNNVLDGALSIFSSALANMSQPIRGDVVSQVLDVIGELRLERISPDQWSDVTFISMLLGQYLKPFLPSVSPSLLQCTSSKNLSCQTYQLILAEFPLMNETQGKNMLDFFILPFLRRNATDTGCVSSANNSVEWLLKNFGSFAEFLKLTELLSINGRFDPLETLVYLTSVQKVELMVEDLPGLPQKEVVINTVFDHLLVSPVDRGLPDVLQTLLLIPQTTVIQCSSLTLIFKRLFLALPFLPSDMQTQVFYTTGELKKKAVTGCSLPEPPTCLITPVNATRVCSGVNSNETLLSAGLVSAPCSIDLQQYACSSLTGFTAENLAGLLKCQLSSSSSYSKEIWKLLFTKTNNVLDGALSIFSSALANMSQPIRGDVVSQVLDVIGELRLERISPDQWSDVTFISMLLGQYLKPFLPSVSPSLLQCTSSKNLSCQTYQLILAEFPLMNETQGKNMLDFFILPFLRRNATDAGCVSSANNSVEWLLKNFGSFAEFLKLTELLSINGRFDPLETLVYLTSVQKVELMVEDLPGLPHKEVVINKVFDHLLVSPVDRGLPDVLIKLLLISQTTVIQCSSLTLIFERLFRALPFLPSDIQTQVFHTTGELKKKAVTGCSLPEPPTCPITPMNATRVCSGVNSNETLLSAGLVSAPCSIDLQQYACSSLTGFTAENLAGLLKCQLSSSSSYSKEIWKLLFTKTDNVLDGALSIFSSSAANMSQQIRGDVVSQVLDVIGELRLERISPDQWSDVTFISMLLGQYLKPFLPSVSPSLLQCTSRKNLSCQTYQHILAEFPLINETQGQNMVTFFILPFLRRNATDAGCVSSANNSVEWLLKNFDSLAQFLKLTELLSINGRFDPLETLVYLTSVQKVELMVEDLPGLPQKEVVINTVFDHLLVSPVDRGLPDVLQTLLLIPQTTVIQCSSLTLIFERLILALPLLPSDMQTQVFYTTGELKKKAVTGCSLPEPPTCLITPVNATRVCSGVNSNETLLSAGLVSAPCSIDLQQYACSSLTGFTAENLAGLLKCQLSSSSSYSKEIWKLLFTKTNNVLDGALSIFSSALANMSQPIRGDVVSQVLDVIGELRLERISPDQWSDVTFISMLLGQYLKPFLPSVSPSLLQCTSSKNLSCQTYQLILAEFPLINVKQGRNMVEFFILPFLRRNATDAGCLSSANNSTEWLLKNFGSFTQFLKLTELLSINGRFDPLETLVYLTSVQKVELMVGDLPGLPQKEVVINKVFDHLLVSPVDRGLPDVLQTLLLIPQTTVIQCSSLTLIFKRLFLALPFLPSDMQTQVFYTTGELKKKAVTGCSLPEPPTCPITPLNATRVCSGVNSNETLLSAGLVSAPCSIDLQQYACSSLTGFTAENLAGLLKCQLSSSSSYSKEIWKLLFTKTSNVLDGALSIFSSSAANMSPPIRGDVVFQVLDVIGELRLERISPDQWSNVTFISMLLGQYLKPFLPSVSPSLLQCTSSKNLSCQTYQLILAEFPLINETQGQNMVKFFILPFLRRNATDAGCVSSANNSTEWLLKNFGSFAQFLKLTELLSINADFEPLETLVYLTSVQKVELMVEDLPGLPQKEVVINKVFDHLLVSPVDRGLPDVLELLFVFSTNSPLSCQTNQIIFTRLDHILRSAAGDLEPVIWTSVYDLSLTAPAGCLLLPVVVECPLTPYNETRVCSGVNSSALQLNNGDASKRLCDFSIAEYACTPVLNVSVEQLVSVLDCHLSAGVVIGSPDSWKLFLTRVSHLLDAALITLSNRSVWWSGSSGSVILDVLRELRLDRLPDDGNVTLWLGKRLRPFLPFASRTFLQCLSSKNFSCQNFQTVVEAFSAGFLHMNDLQRQNTATNFIIPFLLRQPAGAACASNDSSQWLTGNFGQFSAVVPLNQLISLNTQFNPLSILLALSPQQLVALMFDDIPDLPDKALIINAVFDHLIAYPQEERIIPTLNILVESSKTRNISCASYQIIFHRLDHLMVSVPVNLETVILRSKSALLQQVPPGCVSSSGQCGVTQVNETAVCMSVNSSGLSVYLSSPHAGSRLCKFSITQYACAELTALSTQDLATVLSCSLNGNESASEETWKLFTQKVNPVLGPALDLLANTSLNKSRPSVSFLNVIGEVTLSSFSSTNLRDDFFVQRWFESRLSPFLPYASEAFLSCLSTRDFSCDTFRRVVQSFNQSFNILSTETQANVYVDFIKVFLSQNSTAGCVGVSQSSLHWLNSSFGHFSVLASVTDLQTLNPSFNVFDTLSLLSEKQLVEVSSTPGFLSSTANVDYLLLYVPDAQFTSFYTSLSASLQVQDAVLPPPVRDTFLQKVFDRANLTTLSDGDLQFWILNILPPFIVNITVQHVTTYFSIILQRPCPISQQAVQLLNSSSSTFQPATQDQIYQQILGSLTGPSSLRCYTNQSYYAFLTSSFMSFQFPNLTTFLSLMPPARVPELMESISPAEVSSLLNRPNAVNAPTQICQLFTNYPKTPQYLQTQPLGSVALARQVLSCIWPQVLKMEARSEVELWFTVLGQYLPLLTSQFISPDVMQSSSCLSFKTFVSVMAKYNFTAADFSRRDVYDTILVYLNTSSAPVPKCYNTSNPDLNSTAWFVNYISVFLSFITLDDLLLFGSIQTFKPFTVNQENLQLFSQINVPGDVLDVYVTLLFEQEPNFSAYYLPVKFLCLAPASSFLQLSVEQLKNISYIVQKNCTDIPPDVSAALSSNLDVLTVDTIQALGQSCTGLSTAQISGAGGSVLLSALNVLSLVVGWNLDQAMMIIQTLLSSGLYQINSAERLVELGSLIIGVQTSVINLISGDILLEAVKSQWFLERVISASIIVQQTFVSQIITLNSSSDGVITNVPDPMATEIPRVLLLDVSSSSAVVQKVNQKKWKHEQAVLIFETVATEFSDPDAMSFQVLQGFTCSRIQSFSTSKTMSLIRGCRRRANQTLVLQESQLTCMYYYIKSADLNAFSQYPAEVLIYYNYSMIDRSLCRSYFSSLGTANFSVLSSTLSFKKQNLFNSARECLGISGFYIYQAQLDVLGGMCCFLSADYIQNSDPYVLEKLKQCPDLSAQQISAIESVLLKGNTTYGSSNSWNRTTLDNLEILPLYVTANIWSKFTQENKQKFLKTFIRDLRKKEKTSEKKILNMMNEVNKVSRVKIKRSAETACTSGVIEQVQVYSDMFPFAYDVTQFNSCLTLQTLKDNLEAITDRVHDRSYQRIVLDKLNQAYPGGLSNEVLQVLGSASRVATPDDVSKWSVTKIDTLSSLMNSRNGDWDPEMVQLLVSKYLSVSGNTLGTNELNALGGTNLCVLTTSVLNNITAKSMERASALSLTNCSSEKKSILFGIALNAFSATNTRNTNTISIPTYQLLQTYLGGADSSFIQRLVNSSVNMDVPTFISLKQSVINVLNVTDVKSLLGVNVGDLKTYDSTEQIQEWIRLQTQSDLDTLQIGLTGGRNSTATETAATTASTSTTKAPSAAGTTAAGSRVWAPVALQLFLLAVTMTTLQLLH